MVRDSHPGTDKYCWCRQKLLGILCPTQGWLLGKVSQICPLEWPDGVVNVWQADEKSVRFDYSTSTSQSNRFSPTRTATSSSHAVLVAVFVWIWHASVTIRLSVGWADCCACNLLSQESFTTPRPSKSHPSHKRQDAFNPVGFLLTMNLDTKDSYHAIHHFRIVMIWRAELVQ